MLAIAPAEIEEAMTSSGDGRKSRLTGEVKSHVRREHKTTIGEGISSDRQTAAIAQAEGQVGVAIELSGGALQFAVSVK
ncbi:MAG: hypothetical protein HC838_08405 [Spirulinaceae cyanobacterium RM2_2_10]|nr:hypothetical protein [Spirulinaceae cyanobacterium RM2_2_10]